MAGQKLRWCFVAPVYDTGGGGATEATGEPVHLSAGSGRGKIHFTFRTNTFCNFDEDILQF